MKQCQCLQDHITAHPQDQTYHITWGQKKVAERDEHTQTHRKQGSLQRSSFMTSVRLWDGNWGQPAAPRNPRNRTLLRIHVSRSSPPLILHVMRTSMVHSTVPKDWTRDPLSTKANSNPSYWCALAHFKPQRSDHGYEPHAPRSKLHTVGVRLQRSQLNMVEIFWPGKDVKVAEKHGGEGFFWLFIDLWKIDLVIMFQMACWLHHIEYNLVWR